jgi:hypothetical protein
MSIQIQKISSGSELQEIVTESSLTEKEKNVWYFLIKTAPEEELINFLDVFKEDANTISFLTQNLMDKLVAIGNKDIQKQKEIIEKEKEFLGKLSV